MKYCAQCQQQRTGDRFCTTCGTEFGVPHRTETRAAWPPRADHPAIADQYPQTQALAGQPPANLWHAQTHAAAAPAWDQPAWDQPARYQQETQAAYPELGQAATPPQQAAPPAPAPYPPPGQYQAPGLYPPPGPYQAPGPYPPPGQYQTPGQLTPPGQYPAPAGQPRPRHAKTAALVSVAALIVVAAGAGGFALVSKLHRGNTPVTLVTSPAAVVTASPGTTPATTPATTLPPTTPATTTPVVPTTTAPSGTVTLSAAAAGSPQATQVQQLFSQYFDAIKTRNYAEYVSTQASGTSQSQSSFDTGYKSTTDSAEVINSITDNGDGTLTASVSFTSHQNAADSIDGSTCNNWTLSLTLVPQGSGYVMSTEVSHTVGDC